MAAVRYAREWQAMQVGDRRVIRTLTCYQVQSQVGNLRRRHPEYRQRRWATRTQQDGTLLVTRIQ
jgi:hypothetical protein